MRHQSSGSVSCKIRKIPPQNEQFGFGSVFFVDILGLELPACHENSGRRVSSTNQKSQQRTKPRYTTRGQERTITSRMKFLDSSGGVWSDCQG